MENPEISIIISTYGRAEYLKNLIASVRASTPRGACELVVVSSDLPESEKIRWLSQQEDVDLILADKRKDWQLRKRSAHYYINLGIKKSKKEWVFIAGDDVCFCEGWYDEFANLASNPNNSDVGMIIFSTHLSKTKYGRRIVKIGKTKKEDGSWKDLYLADFSFTRRSVLEKIGFCDEKIDWAGGGADIALAVEFLTNKKIVTSENIKINHLIAKEDRNKTIVDEFSGYHYIINKWNRWCEANNCQYIWDLKIKPYTLKNRIVNYLYNKVRILRHYARYTLETYRQK